MFRTIYGLTKFLIAAMCVLPMIGCTSWPHSLGQEKPEPLLLPTLTPELEKVRASLEKYQDPIAAVHDGYFSTVGCVEYPSGGMGVHFLNTSLIGPVPDPLRPQILLYEQKGSRLRLVAAEWFIPLATGVRERPSLLGQPFDGPMEGHHPLMPTGLHHYDLHVWLFKTNPAGLFNATNPTVKCDEKEAYSLKEQPPKPVPP